MRTGDTDLKDMNYRKNLMESMKWSAEQAMSAMKVSEADKALLLKEL